MTKIKLFVAKKEKDWQRSNYLLLKKKKIDKDQRLFVASAKRENQLTVVVEQSLWGSDATHRTWKTGGVRD